MANCKHCGKPAGFFRSAHKECEAEFASARGEVSAIALRAIQGDEGLEEARKSIEAVASRGRVAQKDQRHLIIWAWEQAVDTFLDDGVLDESEESRLIQFKNFFLLNDAELDRSGALTKTVKAGTIRDLLNGSVPTRLKLDGALALNLQKNEQIIWAFPGTEYLEDKTRRHYVGRSKGISVRVMKGVYYRAGAFKGHPVEYTERVSHGQGLFVLTTKHIYFHGVAKSFRVPYQKVVSFEPYSDGIGITRDAANAKAQTFITGDGWFTYNIIANVNNL